MLSEIMMAQKFNSLAHVYDSELPRPHQRVFIFTIAQSATNYIPHHFMMMMEAVGQNIHCVLSSHCVWMYKYWWVQAE